MYSIVLAMALSNGAATPAWHPGEDYLSGSRYGDYGHREYRHRRGGGCCGCSGGGGCYGGGCWGGGGCYGGRGYVSSGGCCGCYGGGGYMMMGHGCYGGVIMGEKPKKTEKIEKPPKEDGKEDEVRLPAPATLIVSLPAEATLTVDGAATQSTSATRVFTSPELAPDKEFYYTLKADLVRNGEKVTTTKKVSVRAGQETRVTLEFPAATVAQK
jgi:uncharacterized protein (TIGR03000 family)